MINGFYRFILERIKQRYIGKPSRNASQVVDCCIYLQEVLK